MMCLLQAEDSTLLDFVMFSVTNLIYFETYLLLFLLLSLPVKDYCD